MKALVLVFLVLGFCAGAYRLANQGPAAAIGAVNTNDVQGLRRCLDRGASVEMRNALGQSLIGIAVLNGNRNAVELLLKHGANPNSRDCTGCSALHFAMVVPDGLPLAQLLVRHGANVNVSTNNGLTPLHLAAMQRTSDALTWLLNCGAYPNARSDRGETPLQVAICAESVPSVKRLLKGGADDEAADNAGITPLQEARHVGNRQINALLLNAQTGG